MNYFVIVLLGMIAALGLFSIVGAIGKIIGILTISWWWVIIPAVIFCIFFAGLVLIFFDGLKYVG